ncbi:uncharacterized protein DNG_04055 [Cephalotrichum gorgonifer]|uniref:Uncharacterized protein n=1 Tax=Cephalotrichum gorgonifer TaxID=2041049 RepID=A0AAE8MW99_9PEZI|nr:uncharacterized protein DNG_04055 [Cephalotrichum gorgonifer]
MRPSIYYHSLLLVFLQSVLAQVVTPEIPCYAPDGVTIADDSYRPCNNLGILERGGASSSCCRLNAVPDTREICGASGLCIQGAIVRRGFCTDSSWDHPACVNFCTSDDQNGSSNGTIELTPCENGSFCCGPNNEACCGTDAAFTPRNLTSLTSPSAPTMTITNTPEPTATQNQTPLAVYLGMGAGILVVMLVSLGVIIFLLRQVKMLRKRNGELLGSAAIRGSRAPVLPPTPHVASMQGFADFKATYGVMIAKREEEKRQAQEKKLREAESGEREGQGQASSVRSETDTVVAEGSTAWPDATRDSVIKEENEEGTPPIPPRGR